MPSGLPEQTGPLTVYYVAVGDNGVSGPRIGCGDSVVATTTAPVTFTDQVGPSINALLANKSRDVGLSGQFMLGGVCDVSRAKAQLEYTAMAASGATSARVFVNNRPIDEVLSLK